MNRCAIVLQARMGSTRLPGKVLARVGGRTLLEHAIRRLKVARLPIVVATTTRDEDAVVVEEASRLGVESFRGDELDVLGRYIGAADQFGLDELIRATGDNPLVDGSGPGRVLELLQRVQADHVVESGLPIGAAVEAVRVDALRRSQALISDPYDREHVTSFIRRDSRFRALRAVAPGDVRRPGLRLTVDTADDLEFIRAVMSALPGDPLPRLREVIGAAETLLVSSIASQAQKGA